MDSFSQKNFYAVSSCKAEDFIASVELETCGNHNIAAYNTALGHYHDVFLWSVNGTGWLKELVCTSGVATVMECSHFPASSFQFLLTNSTTPNAT